MRTPTIIAIIFGVLFNVSGLYGFLGSTIMGKSLYEAVEFLIPMTSPLILLVIGYSLSFKRLDIKSAVVYILSRWVVVLGIGIPLVMFIEMVIDGLDPLFSTAFFAFILLPAPYILPLFIKDKKESQFFSQMLVYSTITSFIGYIILMGLTLI
jgi:predicted permease